MVQVQTMFIRNVQSRIDSSLMIDCLLPGTGTLFVLDTESSGLRICQQFEWSDGLFDLTWAENNENILVTAGGDGSIQVWDVTQPNVRFPLLSSF